MELRHYRYLAAVQQHLSFALAARSLGISVPTLSVQVRYVEDRLGLLIFERTSRRVSVTREGAAFLKSVEAVLNAAAATETVARDLARGLIGEVRIGYVGSAVYAGILQQIVRSFGDRFPQAKLIAEEHVMEELPDLVAHGRIDLALVRGPIAVPKSLEAFDLTRDHFVAAVSSRLSVPAQGGLLQATELSGLPFIVPEQPFGTEEVGRRGAFQPQIAATPGSLMAVLTQVAVSNAVAIVPSLLRDTLQVEGVIFHEIAGPQIPSGIVAIGRSDERAPVVRNLLGLVRTLS